MPLLRPHVQPDRLLLDRLLAAPHAYDLGVIAMTVEYPQRGLVHVIRPAGYLDRATELRLIRIETDTGLGDDHESADNVRGALVLIHKFILPSIEVDVH